MGIKVVISYDDAGAMCYVYRRADMKLLAVGESGQGGAETGRLAIQSARLDFKQYRQTKPITQRQTTF